MNSEDTKERNFEIFEILPEGWKIVPLKGIGNIVTGNTPSRSDLANYGGEIPWVKPPELDNVDLIVKTEETLTEKGARVARLVPKGTVLVSCIGNLGKVGLAGTQLATNQQINSIVLNEQLVLPKYCFFYCKTLKKWLNDNSSATTIPIVNKNRFSEAPFLLPPLSEQHQIVARVEALLSQINAARDRLNRVPVIMKRFRQAVLAAACSGRLTEGWRDEPTNNDTSAKFIQILSKLNVKPYNSTVFNGIELQNLPESWIWVEFWKIIFELKNGIYLVAPNVEPPGNPILRISAVRSGSVNLADRKYLSNFDMDLNKYYLEEKDLLFTRYNGSLDLVGICGMVRNLKGNTLYPDKLIRVRLALEVILPEFTEIFFQTHIARKNIIGVVKSSAGQKGISGKDLKIQPFPLPPLVEQYEIVRRVNALFALADQIEQQVAEATKRTEALTQAVLAKAFRGELVEWESCHTQNRLV